MAEPKEKVVPFWRMRRYLEFGLPSQDFPDLGESAAAIQPSMNFRETVPLENNNHREAVV